mgnify:CR=1 FL=1
MKETQNKNIIDLSLTLRADFPTTWPGMHPYQHEVFKSFPSPQDPCKTCWFAMDEHCGTHCDAPAHFVPSNPNGPISALEGDHLELAAMQGPLAVIDVRNLEESGQMPGHGPVITPEQVKSWEKRNGMLTPGTIVAFMTAWDRYFSDDPQQRYLFLDGPARDRKTPGWPAPSAETLSYLLNTGIRCVGIDAPSIGSVDAGIPPHQFGLNHGMIFIENLSHLEALPEIGAYFIFLPLKLALSTGCPGRAVAYC